MFLKSIAHSWATSKLQTSVAQTRSLVHELDREQKAVGKRLKVAKSKYSHAIGDHQSQRNKQLKDHIDFMNRQLTITSGYLRELESFQSFMFTCLESRIQADLVTTEYRIISAKISNISSTIRLLDAYTSVLRELSQINERRKWQELVSTHALTIVTNEFVEKENQRIIRISKSPDKEMRNEIRRLKSYGHDLKKQRQDLRLKRDSLKITKETAKLKHQNNKNASTQQYELCADHWKRIRKKFEAYYAFKDTGNECADEWLSACKDGGTRSEINELMDTSHEVFERAKQDFKDLNEEYQPYKIRVCDAHDSGEYPDTYENDEVQRKRLKREVTEAYKYKEEIKVARTILHERRAELSGYIDLIKPLHPDSAIETMREILEMNSMEFDSWQICGVSTTRQRRDYWQKQQKWNNAKKN